MVKDPPKVNAFAVMWPYWTAVRDNRTHYIRAGQAKNENYKIIILRETEATEEEKKNATELIKIKKVDTTLTSNELARDMELLDSVEEKMEKEADGEIPEEEDEK
jgi:hypothetical protein